MKAGDIDVIGQASGVILKNLEILDTVQKRSDVPQDVKQALALLGESLSYISLGLTILVTDYAPDPV